jgi:predicted HicB family RNase H-like nuclease
MNTMTYRGYAARLEFDPEDAVFVGRVAGVNDVIGFHGTSVDELRAAFEEAVDDYLEACETLGRAPEKPYSGKVMLRVPPEIHARAALAARLTGKSLNEWGGQALEAAAAQVLPAAAD